MCTIVHLLTRSRQSIIALDLVSYKPQLTKMSKYRIYTLTLNNYQEKPEILFDF